MVNSKSRLTGRRISVYTAVVRRAMAAGKDHAETMREVARAGMTPDAKKISQIRHVYKLQRTRRRQQRKDAREPTGTAANVVELNGPRVAARARESQPTIVLKTGVVSQALRKAVAPTSEKLMSDDELVTLVLRNGLDRMLEACAVAETRVLKCTA